MKNMPEPIIPVAIGTKYVLSTYCIPFVLVLAGATAHVLEEIRAQGWKGWVSALSSGFVAFFAGSVVFTFAIHFYPEYAGGLAGLGGLFGNKSIDILLKILRATAKSTLGSI